MARLNVPFEIKRMEAEAGTIWGVASVFYHVDRQQDRVMKGAFRKTIADRNGAPLPMLWSHDTSQPIGTWKSLAEDDHGLQVQGKLTLSVQRAKEIRDLMQDGAVQRLSIGYMIPAGGASMKGDIRELHQIDLLEVSPVCIPACTEATIDGVKSDAIAEAVGQIASLKDLKDFLREHGDMRRKNLQQLMRTLRAELREEDEDGEDEDGPSGAAAIAKAFRDADERVMQRREYLMKALDPPRPPRAKWMGQDFYGDQIREKIRDENVKAIEQQISQCKTAEETEALLYRFGFKDTAVLHFKKAGWCEP